MKKSLIALALLAMATASAYARDPAEVRAFRKIYPCPGGVDKGSHYRCRGYVVDHIIPLDCGGLDSPSNMQYQTIAEGKAKDKWERNGLNCKHPTKKRT